MIIKLLLDALYGVFKVLTTPINIPSMPQETKDYISQFFDYLSAGAGILANYTPFTYLMVLLGLIVAVDVGIMVYHFVMWIIRKIPMVSIS